MARIERRLGHQEPYTTHNFVFLFAFAQSFVATYYLIRHLTGDRRAAIVAGIMFAFCPFAFARQAHIQLLMVGFLPWAMLAWHRFMQRTSIARAIELGLVLAATGLACAYYGIFAGGMVAFATIWFAITRQRWKDAKYWSLVALAAAVCIATILPFFLPYMRMQEATGFERSLSGQYSANVGAWLISSAWAHRWWAPYLSAPSEVCSRESLPSVWECWDLGRSRGFYERATDVLHTTDDRRTIVERSSHDRRTRFGRDVAWFYVGLALFTFWLTLGPKAGLYTALYYTVPVFSFLRAPSRAGIVVTLCLVVLAAPAMVALMRKRSANAVFAILFVLAVADLYRAPLRMREAPQLPQAYRTLADLPKAPTIELPYSGDQPRISSAFGVHADVDGTLAAADQWL